MQAENYNLGENNAGLLLEASTLTGIRDPYDRMIVAQARVAGLPLISSDEDIQNSGLVRIVWD
jgi:PIN domain nuclease of toxin-antitoxin system